MRRWLPITIAAGAAACVLALESPAAAQSTFQEDSTWRRHTGGGRTAASSIYRFTFELRFGGYYPQIDQEFGGAETPFADYFGSGPQLYFGLEADWTPFRIPYVGRLGAGFGWGMMTANTKAKSIGADPDGNAETVDTGVANSLTIHAMHTSAVLRVDEISRRTVLPIVPYGKVGFGFGVWSSGTANGTSKAGTDCDQEKPTNCPVAEGLSIGPHVGLGAMLGLNWLDPRSAAMARETSRIDQAYVFGEWMWSSLSSGVGKPGMNIGTSSWVLGLALDF